MQIPPLKEMVSSLISAPSVSSTLPQFDQSNNEEDNWGESEESEEDQDLS